MTNFVLEPQPGQTRDCLDPWKMAFVKADGSVSLCCWSSPVGNIKQRTLNEILHDEPARQMRRGLLNGHMPGECVRCPARELIPLEDLKLKVQRYLAEGDREETLALRARFNKLQEDHVLIHRRITELEPKLKVAEVEVANLQVHAHNLEEEREHLRQHVALLVDRVHGLDEGRMSLPKVLYVWTRGFVRRVFLGRKPATPAQAPTPATH
jgi:Iron-sulfur cluster-binding domain